MSGRRSRNRARKKEARGWNILEWQFDPATHKAYEGLFTLGADLLQLRGSLEEGLPDAPQNEEYERKPANVTSEVFRHPLSKWGTFVPGVYGPHPALNTQIINLPWFLWMTPIVDGERLDMMTSDIRTHQRVLNLREATLHRSALWRTKSGATVSLQWDRFVTAAEPNQCVQQLWISSNPDVEVVVESGINADVRTNGWDHFIDVVHSCEGDRTLSCEVLTDRQQRLRVTAVHRFDGWASEVRLTNRRGALLLTRTRGPGRHAMIEKRSFVRVHAESTRAASVRPVRVTDAEVEFDWTTCRANHVRAWRERWRWSDVVIEGDEDSQRAVRVAIFHLMRSHPGPGAALAIDAKGYAGEAYWGRFFWDTEMFLLPFFIHTDPAQARTLGEFRIRTLAGARENARRYGFAGARYAWESDDRGVECCPNPPYADREIHVTADVVYGLAHLARGLDDDTILHRASETIIETARYWMSRLDRRSGDNAPSLLGVMGPDEYTPRCDNNAYTNRMVQFALEVAAAVGSRAGAPEAECAAWRAAASALPISRHPQDPQLVLQCDGFDRLADIDIAALWKDRSRTFASQVEEPTLHGSKCLKQADVLMMMHLFPTEFSDDEVRRAWEYYEPRTTHDSSLSAGIHALIALRLGLNDDAWRYWRKSRDIDLDVAHGGAAEGIHIANCGAIWQVVVHGFAGVSSAMEAHDLTINPRLPRQWRHLAFPLLWRGRRVRIDLSHERVRIENQSVDAMEAVVRGNRRTIPPGGADEWSAAA